MGAADRRQAVIQRFQRSWQVDGSGAQPAGQPAAGTDGGRIAFHTHDDAGEAGRVRFGKCLKGVPRGRRPAAALQRLQRPGGVDAGCMQGDAGTIGRQLFGPVGRRRRQTVVRHRQHQVHRLMAREANAGGMNS